MGRPKLKMSPEERSEHNRIGNNRRKQDQREREADEKAREGQLSGAEVDELVKMLTSMSLAEAALILAELQRDYKKKYGIKIPGLREASRAYPRSEHETIKEFSLRQKCATKLLLIRMYSDTAISRSKARDRNERYELKEAQKAAMLGIKVNVYKEQKLTKKKKVMKKEDKIRETMARIRQGPTNTVAVNTSSI